MADYISAYTGAEIDAAVRQIMEGGGGSGNTPQRGVDYWTEEDIAAIRSYVEDAILNGRW